MISHTCRRCAGLSCCEPRSCVGSERTWRRKSSHRACSEARRTSCGSTPHGLSGPCCHCSSEGGKVRIDYTQYKMTGSISISQEAEIIMIGMNWDGPCHYVIRGRIIFISE